MSERVVMGVFKRSSTRPREKKPAMCAANSVTHTHSGLLGQRLTTDDPSTSRHMAGQRLSSGEYRRDFMY